MLSSMHRDGQSSDGSEQLIGERYGPQSPDWLGTEKASRT